MRIIKENIELMYERQVDCYFSFVDFKLIPGNDIVNL